MGDFADLHTSQYGSGTQIGVAIGDPAQGAVLVQIAGYRVAVRIVTGVTVVRGNVLLIVRHGSTRFATAVIAPGPAVPPPAPDDDTEDGEGRPPPDSDPAPPARPPVTTGRLVCAPVTTGTRRDGVWRDTVGPRNSGDLVQGRYGTQYGLNLGAAFYGTKPRSLRGATVTRATLRLRRVSAGVFAGRRPTLRLLTQASRPSGAPTMNETLQGPSIAVNSTVTFTLPNAWAQAIVNGTRGGIGIYIGANEPYMRFAGRSAWSAAWTLTIDWRRG